MTLSFLETAVNINLYMCEIPQCCVAFHTFLNCCCDCNETVFNSSTNSTACTRCNTSLSASFNSSTVNFFMKFCLVSRIFSYAESSFLSRDFTLRYSLKRNNYVTARFSLHQLENYEIKLSKGCTADVAV